MSMFSFYLITAAILYFLGFYGLASTKNMIKIVISLEVLVMAVNLNFITFAAFSNGGTFGLVDPFVQTFVVISIFIGGAIAAIALSLIWNAYKHYGTLDVRELSRLKE